MQKETIEQKQALLKSEIYDKQYDCDKFVEYLDSIKENGGSEIELWSLGELQILIGKFQDLHRPVEIHLEENYEPKQVEPTNEVIKPEEDRFLKKIRCQRQEQRIVMSAELQIRILNYEKVPGGIFSSAYFEYKILTEPLDFLVTRRYSDFVWLREVLAKFYPGNLLPPLPRKAINNSDELYLMKRQQFLQRFLQEIVRSELLKHDKWFIAFISIREQKDFNYLKSLSDKIYRVSKLENLTTLSGDAELSINEAISDYNVHQNTLTNSIEQLYKKLRKDSKQLLLDIDQTSNSVFNLAQTFGQLYEKMRQFNHTVGKNSNLDITFCTLNKLFATWGNNLAIQIKLVQEQLCGFFKFHHHEILAFKEFSKQRELTEQEYIKFSERLTLKKSQLFQQQTLQRWEVPQSQIKSLQDNDLLYDKEVCFSIMLPKDTQIQQELKNIFAYYNNSIYSEGRQLYDKTVTIFSEHFAEFCKSEIATIDDLSNSFTDIQLQCETLLKQQRHKIT